MSKNALSSKIFLNAALRGALIALPSLFICGLYFRDFVQIASAALISIGLGTTLQAYLDENRTAIWKDQRSPYLANSVLALQLTGVFLGIFFSAMFLQAYGFIQLSLARIDMSTAFNNGLLLLFVYNFQIMLVGTLFALWYRSGGLMLLLSWQAVHWAFSFHDYIRQIGAMHGNFGVLLLVLSMVPHLVLEVLAFVLAGMSGVFMSKAIAKYSVSSDKFIRVSRACLFILLISVISLVFASLSEVYIAQKVFASLRS